MTRSTAPLALAALALAVLAPAPTAQEEAAPAPERAFPALPVPPLDVGAARAAARSLLELATGEAEALERLSLQRTPERLGDLRMLAGCADDGGTPVDASSGEGAARRERLAAVAAVLDGRAREGAQALADSTLGWPKVQYALHELAAGLHERGELESYRALVDAIEEELELVDDPRPQYAALYRLQLFVGDLEGAAASAQRAGVGTGVVVDALRLAGDVDEARAIGDVPVEVVEGWREEALDRAAFEAREVDALLARRAARAGAEELETWDATWLPTLAFLMGRAGVADLGVALGGREGRAGQLQAAEQGPFRAGRACRLAREGDADGAWELARQVVEPSTALFPWAPTRMQRWQALAVAEVVGALARAGEARKATKIAQNADRSARLALPPGDVLATETRGYEVEGPNATRLLADRGALAPHESLGERCARELLVGLEAAGETGEEEVDLVAALEPLRLQNDARLRLALSLPDELAAESAQLAATAAPIPVDTKGVQGIVSLACPIAVAYAEDATPAQARALAERLRPRLTDAVDACVPMRVPGGGDMVPPGPLREVEGWSGVLALLGDRDALEAAWTSAPHGEVRVALLVGAAEALLSHGLEPFQADGQTARRVEQALQLR